MKNPLSICWLSIGVALAAAGPVQATSVGDLRCEFLKNPLGIDDGRPALGWTIQDENRGTRQSVYRVLVATTEELLAKDQGDLWDSGEVKSEQSHLVDYAGKPLVSRQRCFWKVMVKTESNKLRSDSGVWSPPSWWELGLLKPSDWQGC